MEKIVKKPSTLFLPKPVVLITTAHGGRDNVMTAAWANVVCMEPPQVAVAVQVLAWQASIAALQDESAHLAQSGV